MVNFNFRQASHTFVFQKTSQSSSRDPDLSAMKREDERRTRVRARCAHILVDTPRASGEQGAGVRCIRDKMLCPVQGFRCTFRRQSREKETNR